MKIHLQAEEDGAHLIRGHSASTITIGDTQFSESLAISPRKLISGWTETRGDALAVEDVKILLELEPELVLIGTGARQHFPVASVLQSLIENQVGYEIMTTAAACRTYNVLVAEGREVVAGLILPA